ncbi:MAG: hypothetical protein K2W85_10875 [Phycisphaerales bacterium]|nr:hypothetical protein [Phycisphaerales bacterium]
MSQFPPQESSDFAPIVEAPTWPKVVGIISIVLASLALVCGGCGIIQNASAFASGGAVTQLPDGKSIQMPAPSLASVVLGAVGWVWAIPLLVAGIMTVRRAAMGRVLHLVYAALAILITIASIVVTIGDMQRMTAAFAQDPTLKQFSGMVTGMIYGILCISTVLGLGYPGFLLVWFGIMGKRPEVGAMNRDPII